jgi:molecular chaperone GrpE
MKSKPSHHPGNSGSGQTADPKIILPDGQPAPTEPGATGKPDPAAEIASLKDQLLRIRADFENSRKRLTREKEESLKYANQSILSDFLPLLDHLELGLQAAASAKDVASVIAGLKLIQGQFERFLTEHGVTPIDAVGEPFDPHLHEALGQEPAPGKPEGTVLHQRRRGYKMGDRLLRPASVVTVAPAQPA